MRDTILFSGASHTFGLGLEWELDPELNSEEYLSKGVNLPLHPNTRDNYSIKYWRHYRWASLVAKQLGYKEYNVHDKENAIKIGGNAAETLWMMVRDEDKMQDLFSRIKYVILEVGAIRWYDEELHDNTSGIEYPNTIQEMIDVINNPNSDNKVVSETISWIRDFDDTSYVKAIHEKISYLKNKYPDITFLILQWHSHGDMDFETIPKSITDMNIPVKENGVVYLNVHDFLLRNKLCLYHNVKAFNGNYTYNYKEEHASVEGHKRVANMVMSHIKKLEKNENII